MIIAPAAAADRPVIEQLLDAGFGPARCQRTAYRLREAAEPIAGLSFIARDGTALVGSLQCWNIVLAGPSVPRSPLVLLGPVVVAGSHSGRGLASALMHHVLAAADTSGAPPILLIGDVPFYGRFGFSAARTGGWRLPGPVDPARLLLRSGAALPVIAWIEPAPVPARGQHAA